MEEAQRRAANRGLNRGPCGDARFLSPQCKRRLSEPPSEWTNTLYKVSAKELVTMT